jgi:hypothetical protein
MYGKATVRKLSRILRYGARPGSTILVEQTGRLVADRSAHVTSTLRSQHGTMSAPALVPGLGRRSQRISRLQPSTCLTTNFRHVAQPGPRAPARLKIALRCFNYFGNTSPAICLPAAATALALGLVFSDSAFSRNLSTTNPQFLVAPASRNLHHHPRRIVAP